MTYHLLCLQCLTPDDGQRNCPKHVEFYSKNKFEKLVHVVGFIIRIRISISVLSYSRHTNVLGRPRRRWEYNIKMDLQEVGGSRGDWMELAQDRDGWRALAGTVRNFRVPYMWGIS